MTLIDELAGKTLDDFREEVDPENAPSREGIYVLELSSKTVKVGRASSIRARLEQHRRMAASYGVTMLRWDALPCDRSRTREKVALKVLSERYGDPSAGQEGWRGVDFEEVRRVARSVSEMD